MRYNVAVHQCHGHLTPHGVIRGEETDKDWFKNIKKPFMMNTKTAAKIQEFNTSFWVKMTQIFVLDEAPHWLRLGDEITPPSAQYDPDRSYMAQWAMNTGPVWKPVASGP